MIPAFAAECQQTPLPATEWITEPCNERGCLDDNHIMTPNQLSCWSNASGGYVFQARTTNSRHPGGVQVLFADASVHFISQSIDRKVWRALGPRDGDETTGSTF